MPPTADADIPRLFTVAQALALIDAAPVSPRIVELALSEAAGLRLASELAADRDYPPFNKSLMDGYAVRYADILGRAGVTLRVTGEIAAGESHSRAVNAGEAIAIMTGAPIPPGADAVIPIEEVEPLEPTDGLPTAIRILSPTSPGRHIARAGSDVHADALVLHKGQLLGPAQIAVAASIGAARVRVFAPPRAAVLSTGSELVPITDTPVPGQIRNSNSLMLVALLHRLGCDVVDLGSVTDDLAATRHALEAGLRHDTLFVTGGMSMGRHDYVPGLLRELGLSLDITKLRIKPGKPFVFASRIVPDDAHRPPARQYVFGLPGNPVSAFVCTLRLASRLLTRIAGGSPAESPSERWSSGRLTDGLTLNGPREFYQPALRTVAPGAKSVQNELASIEPLQWKGSADIFTLARANALIVRAENEPAAPKGTLIRVIEL